MWTIRLLPKAMLNCCSFLLLGLDWTLHEIWWLWGQMRWWQYSGNNRPQLTCLLEHKILFWSRSTSLCIGHDKHTVTGHLSKTHFGCLVQVKLFYLCSSIKNNRTCNTCVSKCLGRTCGRLTTEGHVRTVSHLVGKRPLVVVAVVISCLLCRSREP